MDTFVAIAVGLGLAAACGFRVFVPLLAASVAANMDYLTVAPGFEWLGSPVAMIAFGTATALEVAAYYVPWLDHVLDTVTTPAAVIAGMVASASVLVDVPPLLKWGVVLVGGGGVAGLMQGATVALRAKSGLFTGGLANVAVASIELIGATATAVLAIVLPLVALALVVVLLIVSGRLLRRLARRRV
ncbi:MAG TPA: DUF4126 domain-containing protein [Gemmatimonadaceae bacterium]|nr:DUF4126 domain-containing protein [Gemmatimonadaceae bacterium]